MINDSTQTRLTLNINGEWLHLKDVSPTETLLELLRRTGRTGTKEGCGDGDCGACTVALLARDANGKIGYQAVNSCLIPIGAVAGGEILTVEGIGEAGLHPVQSAMIETGGSQCGYCTPGFIMSMFAAYYDGAVDDLSVEGNLCRCTGYLPIRRAALKVTNAKADDAFSEKLRKANLANESDQSRAAKLAKETDATSTERSTFRYANNGQLFYRPTELKEVFELLQQFPDATLVAGATDLGLEFSWHTKDFPCLISLEAVRELLTLAQTKEQVDVGAAVPLTHVEAILRGVFPSLDEMLHWFAARQVKNRATFGGNIGTASPIGDLPPVLLSLDAELKVVSAHGERIIPLYEFFKGYRQTDLRGDELIASVIIPKLLAPEAVRRLAQSYKVGKRGTDDISIVAASFAIDLDERHRILRARLAYGGVAATPARALKAEQMLEGEIWNADTIKRAKAMLRETFTPLTDVRGSAEYRNLLVANLFEKFFVEMNGREEVFKRNGVSKDDGLNRNNGFNLGGGLRV